MLNRSLATYENTNDSWIIENMEKGMKRRVGLLNAKRRVRGRGQQRYA